MTKTICVVVEYRNDGGWLLSNDIRAFTSIQKAHKYAEELNYDNVFEDTDYVVEELTLEEDL